MSQVRPYYRFCRFFVRWGHVLGMRGRVFRTDRVPRTGGVILACNHQSFLDPMLAALALPRECDFMARDTLFQHPVFKRLISSLNAFPVRRGEADLAAIKESLRRLRDGRLLIMFPEGTRTLDGRIGPFLPGIGSIAKKAKVPIVPVLIEGAFEAWPRHRKAPGIGRVTVIYGEPIYPEAGRSMTAEALVAELNGRVRLMQENERRRRGLPPLQYTDLQPASVAAGGVAAQSG